MPEKWFILQFKTNSHQRAFRNLTQQGFKTFLPLYDSTIRNSSNFKYATRPLFSGYMFVAFDPENTNWSKINNTYGVSRLITFNSTLKAVPNKFIVGLKQRCDCNGKLLPTKNLKKGDKVKILNGPLANFIANVETLEADQRVSILIDLMCRKTKVTVYTSDLQLSI